MSSIDFEHWAVDFPEHRRALMVLATWRQSHGATREIDPRQLGKELSSDQVEIIARALLFLVQQGRLRQVFKVLDPATRTPVPGEYAKISDIPQRLRGRMDDWFETDDAMVISVLKES